MAKLVAAAMDLRNQGASLDTQEGVTALLDQVSKWIRELGSEGMSLVILIPSIHPATHEPTSRTVITYVPDKPVPGHALLRAVAKVGDEHKPVGMLFVTTAKRTDRQEGEQALAVETEDEAKERIGALVGDTSMLVYCQHRAFDAPRLYEARCHAGTIGRFHRSHNELAAYGGIPNFLAWMGSN